MTRKKCTADKNSPLMECVCNATHSAYHCERGVPVCSGYFCVIRNNNGMVEAGCISSAVSQYLDDNSPISCEDFMVADPAMKFCCCEENCTAQTLWPLPSSRSMPSSSSRSMPSSSRTLVTTIAAGVSPAGGGEALRVSVAVAFPLLAVLALILLAICLCRRKPRYDADSAAGDGYVDSEGISESAGLSSGRGGTVRLTRRCLSNMIVLDRTTPLGTGGYGIVYQGVWVDRQVAIKIFMDEQAFHWEHNLLTNFNLNHNAIISFYGADFICNESSPAKYWLVMEYHPLGSLQRYLQENAFRVAGSSAPTPGGIASAPGGAAGGARHRPQLVSRNWDATSDRCRCSHAPDSGIDFQIHAEHRREFLQLVQSVVDGVDYLHTALSNNLFPYRQQGRASQREPMSRVKSHLKPSIAHCDLKSANILVRQDRSCCIADFGLAVFLDEETGAVQKPVHLEKQKGTNRYQAPESLDNTAGDTIQAYLQQDIFSLGLVLWEVANCIPIRDRPAAGHSPPYLVEMGKGNPSVEDMRQVVCDAGVRPSIPANWNGNETLRELTSIMTSCWQAQPDKRPQSSVLARQLQLLTEHPTQPRCSDCRLGTAAVHARAHQSEEWASESGPCSLSDLSSAGSSQANMPPPFMPGQRLRHITAAADVAQQSHATETSV